MKTPSKEQLNKITETIINIVKYTASEDTQKVLINSELIHLLYLLEVGENNEDQEPSSSNWTTTTRP